MKPTILTWAARVTTLMSLLFVLGACSSQTGDVDSEDLTGADDSTATAAEDLSTSVPIGTTLAATANLNLRSGPGTGYRVLHVIPNGAHVTTVNRTSPSNGWYNIKHNGVIGWSSGAYLKQVTTTSPSTPRAAAIARAKSGVGFSYWWGHGRWVPGSTAHGACYGSCPSCSHSGSNGADCSGYVAKVWDVPTSNSITVDSHPYSTYNFKYQTLGMWHRISRSDVKLADALVHHDGGSGHIFVHESGSGWGWMWTYEARGCSSGIVHDLRTASSAYVAIARNGY